MNDKDFENLLKKRDELIYLVSQKWQRSGLSALISPVFPHCAFESILTDEMDGMLEYTSLWNLIGFPCGSFPVTRVQHQEQFFKDHFQDRWTAAINESCKKSEFLPISLQIIGYAHEDEKILGIMRRLEKKLLFGLEPPVI
jgi:Asp-tRNA(Asn)/Glu-tRNA(Gln) amidotransferase A subunit family amidase